MPGKHGICKSLRHFILKKIPHYSILTYFIIRKESSYLYRLTSKHLQLMEHYHIT